MSRGAGLSDAELYDAAPKPHGAARRKAFHAAFRRLAGPELKADGFTVGSRCHRVRGDAVHVVQLEAWKYGGGVSANLGVHFRFLPLLPGAAAFDRLDEAWCALRWRLVPHGHGDFWWRYGDDDEETAASVAHLLEHLRGAGVRWFADFGAWPGAYAEARALDDVDAWRSRLLMGVPVLAVAHVLAAHGRGALARALVEREQARVATDPHPNSYYVQRLAEHGAQILATCAASRG